jgi:3-hydroxybutyrate dehydrogenase
MNLSLKGKVALVTGSTSGIGFGIAQELARHGCEIALNGFGREQEIELSRKDLAQKFGVRVAYIGGDLSRPDECRLMVQQVKSELGGPDILVNNAGIQHVAPIEQFQTEKWDAILAVNLSAAFHLAAAALPTMRDQGWGRIINIASVHGLVASKNKAAYVAAKHGLIGLTRVVALEAAGQGVTCNAICPGWVLTPMVQGQVEEKMESEGIARFEAEQRILCEKQPSRQFVKAENVGSLAVFLCSESAANVTGAALPIDGGWTAQ